MLPALYILADGDDFSKVIFGIIVFVIWGIGALASAVKKQKENAQRRSAEMLEQARREQSGRGRLSPPPIPESMARQMPPMPRPTPHAAQQRRPKAVKAPKVPKIRRDAAVPVAVAEIISAPAPESSAFAGSAAMDPLQQRAASAAKADAIRRWLRPQTLRSQYILTEILRPPIALRDQDDPA